MHIARSQRRCSTRRLFFPVRMMAALALMSGSIACAQEDPAVDGFFLRPDGDILAAGAVVSARDTVPGDVMVTGRSIDFDGRAGGSYLGAANDQRVEGRIDGSVRAAGNVVVVNASIGRNATVAGRDVTLADDAVLEGNAYLAGAMVRVEGEVAGDVYAGGAEVVIAGRVGGDVRVEAGALRVGPDARIDGELRYRLDEETVATISADAVIDGGTRELEPREDDGNVGFFVLRLLAFVLAGLIVVGFFPGTTVALSETMSAQPAAALGYGLLWAVVGPLAVVLLAVTVVGIPAAVGLAVLYGTSLYLAPIAPALWVGGEIVRRDDGASRGRALLVFAVGGVVVAFAILLPWIGLVARPVATLLGLGAVVLALRPAR